ncbi:MAG: ubiquitin-like protein Pup, partial [Acidimicrobiia bacterium]
PRTRSVKGMVSASRQQRARLPKEEAEQLAEDDARQAEATRNGNEVVEELVELLDEIDSLLEEQAVLTNFRQKGGE